MNLDEDALIAAADLVGRAGAREFQIGWDCPHTPGADDDHTCDGVRWYAHAQFRGARITEEHLGPVEAAEALVRRLLTGAKCTRCGRLVALSDRGAIAFDGKLLDGTEWTAEQARKAGQCRWRRMGQRWEMGCPQAPATGETALTPRPPRRERRAAEREARKRGKRAAPAPAQAGADSASLPTTERLAQALEALGDPKLEPVIQRAREGHYDDFKSLLPMPLHQLVTDLRAAGHGGFAKRVMEGEFDVTKEESEAWARSPEGQAVFEELARGKRKQGG